MASHFFGRHGFRARVPSKLHQRGISLAVVLISLVVMALAAVGLTRMVDAGTLIIGNIAFKQNATSAADRGMEAAMAYLRANGGPPSVDDSANGYFASVRPTLDATWSGSGDRVLPMWNGVSCVGASGTVTECLQTAVAPGQDGNQVRYLIIRLCENAGDASQWALRCMRPLGPAQNYTRPAGGLDYNSVWTGNGVAPSPLYRVIVRSTGPRNTVSYTDTYVQIL